MEKSYSKKSKIINLYDRKSFTFFIWLVLKLLILNHFTVVIYRIIRRAYLFHQIFYLIHIVIFIFFHPYLLFINFKYLSNSYMIHFHFSPSSDFTITIVYFYPFILFFHLVILINYVFIPNTFYFAYLIFIQDLVFVFYMALNYHLTILAFHAPRPQSLLFVIWEFIEID